jgi:anaerobic magnesium-protoporphyrin IX monomethyl ester cyclase
MLLWVKFIEAVMQLRPRSLWRLFAQHDRAIRAAMRWYYRIGRKVWFHEIWNFLFRAHPKKDGPSLEEFWGEAQDEEQHAMERHSKKDHSKQLEVHVLTVKRGSQVEG